MNKYTSWPIDGHVQSLPAATYCVSLIVFAPNSLVIQNNNDTRVFTFYAYRMEMDGLHHAIDIVLFARQRARNYSCCCMLWL